MRRYRQTTEELLANLSRIRTTWKDEHATAVVSIVQEIPERERYTMDDVAQLLEAGFDAGTTTIRLILEMSKDEFSIRLRELLGEGWHRHYQVPQ